MDTPELAALVARLMQPHVGHQWRILSGQAPGEDLLIELFPLRAPERIATVCVHAGAEIFILRFAGHESGDFAYGDDERKDALRARIDLAVAATIGPTRVTLERVRGVVIRSTLVIDADGGSPKEDAVMSWPFRRLSARLLGRQITREVVDLPAVSGDLP